MSSLCNLSCAIAGLFLAALEPASAQSALDPAKREEAVTLKTAEASAVGTFLATHDGRAVYMFTADKPGASACRGPCAKDWAPVTTRTDIKAGDGVEAGKIGTISAEDGLRQATYADHPLYYFIHDAGGGTSTTGQATGSYSGFWYLLTPQGEPIKAKRSGEFPEPGQIERKLPDRGGPR